MLKYCRFTDFLVHEVNLDGEAVRIKSIAMPSEEAKKDAESTGPSSSTTTTTTEAPPSTVGEEKASDGDNPTEIVGKDAQATPEDASWPERFNTVLKTFFSESHIEQLKKMYLEGPEPPFVSDSGWIGRQGKGEESSTGEVGDQPEIKEATESRGKRGKRGRERGGRGRGRGGGGGKREDHRKVLSDPIESKESRTNLHKAIREVFGGKLESETDSKANHEGGNNRIIVKWAKQGGNG